MFGNKKDGEITFYYNSDSLFNDVSILSAYMTKNIASESASVIDELVITDDEKEVYEVCVKQSLPNIWETLMKMSSGVSDAFSFVVIPSNEETGLKRPAGSYVEFTILDNKAYNNNVLELVNATLYDCIKYGVLTEFYSINTHAGLQGLSQSKFANSMLLLNQRLFQLKKKCVPSL